jgi:opacity protein-like surface antigen
MKRLILPVLGFCLMTTSAFAGHPLVSDDTGTQGKGKGQVEVGFSYFYDEDRLDEQTTHKTDGGDVVVGITFGVFDTLDVIVGLPYVWYRQEENNVRIASENGISDITFDVKWRIFEKDGWSLAVKPGGRLPTGNEDKGLGAGRTGLRLFLVGPKELNPFAVHVNAGYIVHDNNTGLRKDLWHASVACEVEVLKDVKLMANAGMERNPDPASNNHPAFAMLGVSYNVSEKITLDAGIKYGVTSTETDWTGLAGMTSRF